MSKHGKTKKGARQNKKLIAKDIQLRTTRTAPDNLLLVIQSGKSTKSFWYWRRNE